MLRLQHYILLTGEEIADLLTVHFIHVKLVLQILFSLKKKGCSRPQCYYAGVGCFPHCYLFQTGREKKDKINANIKEAGKIESLKKKKNSVHTDSIS